MNKILPRDLTSYDLLKTLAVILMIIDHVGHHFFPDEMWFRVVGRLCVPIWFFLIGYADTVKVSKFLWLGAFLVGGSALIAGQFLLPLNILFTIILFRFVRQGVLARSLHSPEALRGMFLILLFFTLASYAVFEYGSIAMMFVLMGFIVRHKEAVYERIERKYILMFVCASFFSFYFWQGMLLPSANYAQATLMLLGFGCVGWILWHFRSVVYVDAHQHIAPSLIKFLQFMGRRTLEIYVAHILIFRAICMYLFPDDYRFLEWDYVPVSLIAPFM
ncbi:MAG: TraX family protein [Alphaproteobacteria bacterium]